MPIIDREFSPNGFGKERNHSSKVLILAVVLIALLMLGATAGLMVQIVNNGQPHATETPVRTPARVAYASHSPIIINSNAGFTGPNSSTGITRGNGTPSDPYVIEGWEISGWTSFAISITSADVHFVIRDCYVHDMVLGALGIYFSHCSNGTVKNCIFANDGVGIWLDYSGNNSLVNNTCSGCWRGIYANSGGNNCLINNNCSNSSGGIDVDGSSNNMLVNNTCSSNGNNGIYLYSASNNTVSNNTCWNNAFGTYLSSSSNNTLSDNNCSRSTYSGIHLYSSTNSVLSDNTCSNNTDGIFLLSSSNDVLRNNTCNSNGRWGIRFDLSNDSILSNNTCSSNNEYGIYLVKSHSNTLNDNTCSNNPSGIRLYSEISGTTVSNNNCSDNGDGIYLEGGNDNTLSNNTCSNDIHGIFLFSFSGNALSNNTCSNNSYGIYIYYSTGNTLSDNICSDNEWGIRMAYYSDHNNISNTTFSGNVQYGMYIDLESRLNMVWNNTFIGNNGATGTYDASHVQACDYGTNNSWNSTDGYGNHWGDWQSPDNVPPYGIVDLPYNIAGSAGARDYYPLTTTPQVPIPEFGMMPLLVTAFMAVIVLAGGTRLKKKSGP